MQHIAHPISVPKRMRPAPSTAPPPMWLPLTSPDFPPSTPASAQTVPSFSPCLLNAEPVCPAAAVSLSLAAIDASLGVCVNPSPDVALNALSADDIDISTSLVSHPPPPSSLPWLPLPAPLPLPLPPIEQELDVAIASARRAQKEQEMSIDRILRIAATNETGLYEAPALQRRPRDDDDAVSASSTISSSKKGMQMVQEENSLRGDGCVLERLRMVEQQLEECNGSSTTVTSPPVRRGRGGRVSKRRRVRG